MNRFFALAVFACAVACAAQTPQIRIGSKVFIEPMGGYESYLAAAFTKKHVPLVMVTEKDRADYVIRSTATQSGPSAPKVVVNTSVNNVNNGSDNTQNAHGGYPGGGYPSPGSYGHTSASISVIDSQSSQIMFACSAEKIGANQLQRTAEDCAKHLRDSIEKSERLKK